MNKRILIAALLVWSCSIVRSQYWSEQVNYDTLVKPAKMYKEKYVNLLDERTFNLSYGISTSLAERVTNHQQYLLNTQDAIDGFNKIYIPQSESTSLLDYNARVIAPNGKVRELSKGDIKTGVDEDGQQVTYFALSGVEVGSVVEYYYVFKRLPQLTGIMLTIQRSVPTIKAVVKIISPKNFVFSSKSLNGLADMAYDTTFRDEEKHQLKLEQYNIPALVDEKFANNDANAMAVIYQLYENTNTQARNIYNYGDASKYMFKYLNVEVDKNTSKTLQKLLKESDWMSATNDREKILRIENYVKRNFNFSEDNAADLANLNFILANRALNSSGAAVLLFKLYQLAGIPLEIVVTCNKSKLRFDSEYESYTYLNDYLLYFPQIDDYLSPSADIFRLGLIGSGFLENNALFIKKVGFGGTEMGAGEVRQIKSYPSSHTGHHMDIKVSFTPEADQALVKLKNEYMGYYAATYQPIYSFIDATKEKELNEGIITDLYPGVEPENIKIENKGVENLMLKPFIVSSNFSAPMLVEKAGQKVLFKVGELIGPQTELYQETTRVSKVENTYNRSYNREIEIQIPEGYDCKNAEILNLSMTPFGSRKNEAFFTSTYKIDGNKILVEIKEEYNELVLPKEDYENFRKVVNAAADFNKLVLVFEKK